MMLVSEGKITIDMDETREGNHASVASNQKKCSRSQIMPNTLSLLFGSFTLVEVEFPRKTHQSSLEINENETDGRTLVRIPITLDEFFPEKIFYGSQIGATYVISSTEETKERKGKRNAEIT
ncbi:hypothetical protein H5410_002221 [Solanum commersonii]|uniref:Uncharacterized protein n=1 Tax=Solanum commersonii TaxID=4109 RepID=A0A9J6B1D9_SOLCO|nr:hypothetical protein H5410_002221 [Solanum commersonii]